MRPTPTCQEEALTSALMCTTENSSLTLQFCGTAGKLKNTILHFYAQTSDHVKRLATPVANGKFSASDADADTPYKRPEALRSVVQDLRVGHPLFQCTVFLVSREHGATLQSWRLRRRGLGWSTSSAGTPSTATGLASPPSRPTRRPMARSSSGRSPARVQPQSPHACFLKPLF